MKFTINRDQFVTGLSKVQNIVSAKASNPILNNVLVRAEGETIALTTTNLDLGISCKITADVKQSGTITLPVKKLLTIVRALPNSEVNIEADGTKARITSGGSLFRIMGIEDTEYPALPSLEGSVGVTISQEDLQGMLKSVSYAQSTDENRHILNGVYFSLEEGKLTLVATDGRRLGMISKDLPIEASQAGAFILPAKTATELERLLGVGENVQIAFNARQVAFTGEVSESAQEQGLQESVYLVSKVVEGNYPNYNQVIPKETVHRVRLDREHLLECLSRASLVTTERSNSIRLKVGNNLMEIAGSSPELGESHESMAIEFDDTNVELSFNPQYLIDPLKVLTKDEVYFEFKDELSPGLFKTLDTFLCVIMPLRLN